MSDVPGLAVLLLAQGSHLLDHPRVVRQYYLDDRKYFEVPTFYDEFAKSWDQRRLPMRYEPQVAAVDVYRFWNERNGGLRKSTIVPSA
jgi:guanine deaminase